MITGKQIRAARALLNWSGDELAEKADLHRETVNNIETGKKMQHRGASSENIEQVLSANGIEFIGDRGVALKNDEIVTLSGDNIFFRVLDDVISTLKKTKKAEALFACVDDGVSPPVVIENYRRLRKSKIAMRSLVQEGNSHLMGALEEYRYLPKEFFHNSTTVIYGDKFATMILDPETKTDIGAIIIRNPHVAAAQRNLFNLIWSKAEMPTKTTAKVRYDD